jgi:hypothetical protein
MMLVLPIIALALAPPRLVLRGGEAAPAGQIMAVDAGGVHLGPERGSNETLIVTWDRVKALEGVDGAEAFSTIAEDAWRARTRLERGDFMGAEPLFERVFATTRDKQGPTAALVAEGLLRCRLRRGAHVAAIEPWLAVLKAGSGARTQVLHEAWASEAGLSPVIDPATLLVPGLPPAWLPWQAVEVYGRGVAEGGPAGGRGAALAQIYAQAARFEAGLPAALPELATNDPGVALAWQVVQARIGTPEQRDAARIQLLSRLRPGNIPPWQEAWCRAGLGRSMIREESTEQRQLGVIELLNIPARYSRAHPFLAGLALAEASVTLRGLGDRAGAEVLARELFAQYPSHPVLDWEPIRGSRPSVDPVPARPVPTKEGAVPENPEVHR